MDLNITGNESGAELVNQLAAMRIMARRLVARNNRLQNVRNDLGRRLVLARSSSIADAIKAEIAQADEFLLAHRFAEIETGKYLTSLCRELDLKAPRELVFDALNTNKADRDTERVRKYGTQTIHLIAVLDLENSATKDGDIEIRPLKWCQTMAMLNAMQTNSTFDRIVHDEANEHFGGVFGEYRDRPLMERLAGRAV